MAFFDVSMATLYQWRTAGEFGGRGQWDCKAILKFRLGHLGVKDFGQGARVDGRVTPALERYREEQAALKRLDRLEREKILIRVDVLHSELLQVFGLIRQAGERLQRMYGPEAQDVINEQLDEAERWVCGLSELEQQQAKPPQTNGKPKRAKRKKKVAKG